MFARCLLLDPQDVCLHKQQSYPRSGEYTEQHLLSVRISNALKHDKTKVPCINFGAFWCVGSTHTDIKLPSRTQLYSGRNSFTQGEHRAIVVKHCTLGNGLGGERRVNGGGGGVL